MKIFAALLLMGVSASPAYSHTGHAYHVHRHEHWHCHYHRDFCHKHGHLPGPEHHYEERHYHPRREHSHQTQPKVDDNSCIEGAVLGGILGGGIGAAASRGDGRWWAIPLGIVGGSMVGCQADGG